MKLDKVVVVFKKSTYELYSASRDAQVRNYAQADNEDGERLRKSDENNKRTLDAVVKELSHTGISHEVIYRADFHQLSHEDADLLIIVGGDGTLLDASHYIGDDTPLFGVNSDPEKSFGYFSQANMYTFGNELAAIEKIPLHRLTRISATLDGAKLPELILNDVLIAHQNPAAMTRYRIYEEQPVMHKNSGLLICTAAGSTAFMRNERGIIMPLDSRVMQYRQRSFLGAESFFTDHLKIESVTREGMIWMDGEHITYNFGLGSTLTLAEGNPLYLIADLEAKRKNL